VAGSAHPLRGKHIVLGVSGGIAAYKAVELLRLFVKAEAQVQVVMTKRATEFVGALTFQALSGRGVFTDMFSLTQESEIGHIQVADTTDLIVIAPATANTIARLSAGFADDPLAAVCLATKAPVLLAPSMNVNMWSNPITQANLRRLIDVAGMAVVGPGTGFLACRWTGPGRLAEPPDIAEAAARILSSDDLSGKRVVISAGPTQEAIDPVRFVSNRSTGKMGYALALAAARRGADVELISGPVSISAPLGIDVTSVRSAEEMHQAVVGAAATADAVVMAAAVGDYRPTQTAAEKLKKSDDEMTLDLERTVDILSTLGVKRSGSAPLLIGFAAETENVMENARAKLTKKGCDMIVANDVSQRDAGFGVDTNRVTIVTANGDEALDLMSKDEAAHAIWDRVLALF